MFFIKKERIWSDKSSTDVIVNCTCAVQDRAQPLRQAKSSTISQTIHQPGAHRPFTHTFQVHEQVSTWAAPVLRTTNLHSAGAASACEGSRRVKRAASLGQRDLEAEALSIKKYVKSIRVFFSFPWLGVSMLADSPSEWSKCTGKLPVYWSRRRWKKFFIGCDVQPNNLFSSFFFLCDCSNKEAKPCCFQTHTHTHTLRCLSRLAEIKKVNSVLGEQEFCFHPVILNHPPAKFSLNIKSP